MPVARLIAEIAIPHAHSLKQRRQVVRSLRDRLRHAFNVSVAELDDASLWNRATLGVVAISASASYLAGQMQAVESALHRQVVSLGAEILDSFVEPACFTEPDSFNDPASFPDPAGEEER